MMADRLNAMNYLRRVGALIAGVALALSMATGAATPCVRHAQQASPPTHEAHGQSHAMDTSAPPPPSCDAVGDGGCMDPAVPGGCTMPAQCVTTAPALAAPAMRTMARAADGGMFVAIPTRPLDLPIGPDSPPPRG